jgi:hypothetical protein
LRPQAVGMTTIAHATAMSKGEDFFAARSAMMKTPESVGGGAGTPSGFGYRIGLVGDAFWYDDVLVG